MGHMKLNYIRLQIVRLWFELIDKASTVIINQINKTTYPLRLNFIWKTIPVKIMSIFCGFLGFHEYKTI